MSDLPDGFTLDAPPSMGANLPSGFQLDSQPKKQPSQPQDQGFLSRVGEDLSKRNQMVQNAVDQFGVGPSSLAAGVGKGVFGSVNDITSEAAKSAYSSLPNAVTQPINSAASNVGNYLANTDVGKAAIDLAKQAGTGYSNWAQQNPTAANAVESGADVASGMANLMPIAKGAGAATETLKDIATSPEVGRALEQTAASELPSAATPKAPSPEVSGALGETAVGELTQPSTLPTFSKAQLNARDILSSALKTEGINPEDVASSLEQSLQSGKPLTALDVATKEKGGILTQGKNLVGLTKAAATFPGEAASLSGDVASRGISSSDRIGSDFDKSISQNPFYGVKDQIGAQQQLASPFYKQFYAANSSMQSPLIDSILGRPAGLQALSNVAEDMQNAASRMANPDPELTEQARDAGLRVKGGVGNGLKAQTLDYVKQDLDAQAQAAKRAYFAGNGTKREWNTLSQMAADLRNEMDRLDVTAQAGPNSLKPEGGAYAQARKLSAQGFQMDDALEQGRNFMQQDPEEINSFFKDPHTSDPVKAAYLSGQRRALQDMADNKALGSNPISSFTKPAIAKRLQASLGASYNDLAKNLETESTMARINQIHTGGSDTMLKSNYAQQISPESIGIKTGIKTFLNPKQTAINMLDKSIQKKMASAGQDTAAEIMRYMTSNNPDLWRSLVNQQKSTGGSIGYASGGRIGRYTHKTWTRLVQQYGKQAKVKMSQLKDEAARERLLDTAARLTKKRT